MSTSITTQFETDWRAWHAARERALATQYGWLSLTSFHWLPADPAALTGLPGVFSVRDGHAVLSAGADDGYTVAGDEDGSRVPVEGRVHAGVAEGKSLNWLEIGDVHVELALRGGRYAVRTRDRQAAALRLFSGVPAFEVDENWILSGSFEPFVTPRRILVETAREDLAQEITAVGTLAIERGGHVYRLIAGPGIGGTLDIAFHDDTNGDRTARWRAVSTTAPDDAGRVEIDFNRAVNFPFAFSEYGTCPATPAGNVLPFAVTAGELLPLRGSRA